MRRLGQHAHSGVLGREQGRAGRPAGRGVQTRRVHSQSERRVPAHLCDQRRVRPGVLGMADGRRGTGCTARAARARDCRGVWAQLRTDCPAGAEVLGQRGLRPAAAAGLGRVAGVSHLGWVLTLLCAVERRSGHLLG